MTSPASLPAAFIHRMQQQLGSEYPAFEASLQEPATVSIRYNPSKLTTVAGNSIPWSINGRYLESRPSFTRDPRFHAGAYYVQEASSMFIEQVFKQYNLQQEPLRILDLCGAPGGKSTHAVSLIHEESLVVANEVIRSRASILAENLTKWGYANALVTNNDPRDFQSLTGFFDVIILDAPCSGEGLFRKDAHATEEWSEQHVDLCARRQRRIVEDIWPCLKHNGILIYSTCTYSQDENENNLQWIRTNYKAEWLSLETDPSWNIEPIQVDGITGYRFYPHRVAGEGFFLSAIRKLDTEQEESLKFKRTSRSVKNSVVEQVSKWIREPERFTIHANQEHYFFTHAAHAEWVHFFEQHFRMVTAGTSLAVTKGDKILPEHACALSIYLNNPLFPHIDLTREEALTYLRKDSLPMQSQEKGFNLVTYQNLAIGWVNALENRMNNLYPKEWRIRNL
jgi:16S rRNA C967 or C1407 C5-methylase (RsmB/RsmF family)/NOL1/NOP2/fmu family ribosome biogenesis protein